MIFVLSYKNQPILRWLNKNYIQSYMNWQIKINLTYIIREVQEMHLFTQLMTCQVNF